MLTGVVPRVLVLTPRVYGRPLDAGSAPAAPAPAREDRMTTFQAAAIPGEPPPPDSVAPRDSTPQAPTSVARLGDTIRGFIQTWGSVWVEGEITTWNLRSGNVFGRLKDLSTDSTIAFRIWSSTRDRLPADLKVGDHVVARRPELGDRGGERRLGREEAALHCPRG